MPSIYLLQVQVQIFSQTEQEIALQLYKTKKSDFLKNCFSHKAFLF